MRVKLSMVLAAAALVALAFGPLAPADAGPGEPVNEFVVNKVVEGPVPAGTVFEVQVVCTPDIAKSPSAELVPAVTFQFDENGDPIGDNSVGVSFFETCTAEETDDGGADSVSYACEVGQVVGAPEGDGQVQCVDDQTVYFGDVANATGIITVTNVFAEDEEPPPDVEPDDVVPDVVNASPSFTG